MLPEAGALGAEIRVCGVPAISQISTWVAKRVLQLRGRPVGAGRSRGMVSPEKDTICGTGAMASRVAVSCTSPPGPVAVRV